MTKSKKGTKRALLMSALSLLMCVSMLVGSTFAWFTDSVTSANNVIQSGNLDMVLEYKTDVNGTWAPVGSEPLFDENALYEPGYTEVVFLRVSNAGSLAFKYQLLVEVLNEDTGTNVYGEEFKLSDYLQIGAYVMDESMGQYLLGAMFGSRENAKANIASVNGTGFAQLSTANSVVYTDRPVSAGDDTAQLIALVLTMPETVGNEANHNGTDAPEITLGVTAVATQLVAESDSFGSDYDKDAEYPTVVATVDELKDAIAAGENVTLGADIALNKNETLVIASGVDANIDLNGYTLSIENSRTETHNDMVKVNGGELTLKNGTVSMNHTGANMGWNGATTVINVTANGVLNLENVVVENKGGTDMNFAVHLNNWGKATVNANNCSFLSSYCGFRVFNSGPDMNYVTIKNSKFTGGTRAFWVHNYASADFGGKLYSGASAAYDEASVAARLNFDIFGNGNTFEITGTATSPIRYGFNSTIYFDVDGNKIN